MNKSNLTPEQAADRLEMLYDQAVLALKTALELYFVTRTAPSPGEREKFRYPELRVTYEADGLQPSISRAYAKFQAPGTLPVGAMAPSPFPTNSS